MGSVGHVIMQKDDLVKQFAEAITEWGLLARDEPVLVAVSGGCDSVAMLDLFRRLSQSDDWSIQLHVAHLNHQLRGKDSDGDAAFVEKLARRWKLPVTIESVNVAGQAAEAGVSIEQAARQCRFALYNKLCLRLGIKAVALAHHADDNAETVLYRIVRGTGIRGLGGIRPVRPLREGGDIRVIRPMLGIRRAEIEAYLRERKISCRHDASNDSDAYARNRIRHEVLPLLSDRLNPQVTDALNRLAEQAAGLEAYLTETAERMLESLIIQHDDRQIVLHSPPLARKARVIQMQLIRQALLLMGIGESDLTYGHFKAVADLAGEFEGSKAIDLPGGLRVTRRYTRLVFERSQGDDSRRSSGSVAGHVAMEGVTVLSAHGIEITAEIFDTDEETVADHIRHCAGRGQTSTEEWLDARQVHPPLLARSRRPGDRFFPLGMTGMKKLSDFFIDEKIDVHLRERTVVLCDQLGPIWIVPFRIDERVRLTQATRRVLRLRARCTDPASST